MYTLAKFREFQIELTGTMYCTLVEMKEGSAFTKYVIREVIQIENLKKRIHFDVCFGEDHSEVYCNCRMFEFKGILCKHSLSMLIRNEVDVLPDKYIIRRRKKDVRRTHTKMKLSFNTWQNSTEQQCCKEMCVCLAR
ncbi:protein FAR1-RELATED SEQUENCE 9-like [Iris pallida]|uniref:Protein FAR1-RELATED SEQUENCE n=1 Tax=Iris pallida TaxID=29817 RepID=A0AAX6DUC0_IRIPA|nr:protein FAR1-RELATED SEQUENCE 9-like [Iris pallida]